MRPHACGLALCSLGILGPALAPAAAQVAVKAGTIHTMAGPAIRDGVVVITRGKIAAVGAADAIRIPEGHRVLEVAVVTPGLIDAHTVIGLAGYLNQEQDQDQLERSAAMQPELRAIDAYNFRERLIEWVRGLGVTTLHTGHGEGALISGQTMIVKTAGKDMDAALVRPMAMVAATLGPDGQGPDGKPPGNRSKAVAMLRQKLLQALRYREQLSAEDPERRPPRDLGLDVMVQVLEKKVPLLVTVHRSHDILTALRLREEFGLEMVLDGASEAYLVTEQIKAAGVPVIAHPPMMRSRGERENATFELGDRLAKAGIRFAYQSGYESYVPKTRVVLWEAAIGAANGLGFEKALAAITIDAARLLRVDDRIGSISTGKDGDLALYDGDPFEYATHCTATIVDGRVVHRGAR